MTRAVLPLILLIVLGASANAATVHRSGLPQNLLRPSQRVMVPKRYAVPGWTNQETDRWLDNASAASGLY